MRALLLLLGSVSAFAAGKEIAPRPLAPTPYHTTGPQTAFAANRFLTIWTESRGEIGHSLMGVLSDEGGRRVSARALLLQPFFSDHRLVGTGNSFALFWTANGRMSLSDIDAQGNVVRTKVLDLPPTSNFRAAWNGERFLLLHEQASMHAYLLDRSGAIVATDAVEPYAGRSAALVPHDGGFTLVTSDLRGPHAQRIANDGAAGPLVRLETDLPGDARTSLTAAPTPTGTLVVWSVYTAPTRANPGSQELRSVVVRADGEAGPVRVLARYAPDVHVTAVHLSRGEGLYGLTFATETFGTAPRQVLSLALRSDGIAASEIRLVTAIAPLPWLAAASSAETTHVVFADAASEQARLKSIAVANDGHVLRSAEDVTVEFARQGQPALSEAAPRLLAAWTESSANGASVRTASLGTDGSPVREHTVTEGELASPDVAWNGAEGLVLVRRPGRVVGQLYAAFVDLDGAPLNAELVPLGDLAIVVPPPPVAAIGVGDRWLVAWADSQGRLNVTVLRNRAIEKMHTLALTTTVPEHRDRWLAHLALAHNGSDALLAWTEELRPVCATLPPCGDGLHRTYAARLTAEGALATGPLEVPGGTQSLSVATSGDEFLIVADGTASVVGADAHRVRRSTTVFSWDAPSDVTWNGSAYTVALRYHLTRWYLAVAHLDRTGRLLGPARGSETLAADTLIAPSIAGSFVALQEGDAANGTRAVVYDERELTPLPPPPPSPVPRIRRTGDDWYEITWEPVPGAEVYVVESIRGEERRWVRIVPASWSFPVNAPSGTIRVTAVGPGGASAPPPRQRSARH